MPLYGTAEHFPLQQEPWSIPGVRLPAFIWGDHFDTQFKRSERFDLHVYLWTIIQDNKSQSGLIELHGAMSV